MRKPNKKMYRINNRIEDGDEWVLRIIIIILDIDIVYKPGFLYDLGFFKLHKGFLC